MQHERNNHLVSPQKRPRGVARGSLPASDLDESHGNAGNCPPPANEAIVSEGIRYISCRDGYGPALTRAVELYLSETGLSGSGLAAKIGVHRATVQRWRTRKAVRPYPKARRKLDRALAAQRIIIGEPEPSPAEAIANGVSGATRQTVVEWLEGYVWLTTLPLSLPQTVRVDVESRLTQLLANAIAPDWGGACQLAAQLYHNLAAQHNVYPVVGMQSQSRALELLVKGCEICPRKDILHGRLLHSMALAYHCLRDFDRARKSLDRAIEVYDTFDSSTFIAASLADLSRLHSTMYPAGDSGRYWADKAVELAIEAESSERIFTAHLAQALALLLKSQSQDALDSLENAIQPFRQGGLSSLSPLWNYLYFIHRGLAFALVKDVRHSDRAYEAALHTAQRTRVEVWAERAKLLRSLTDDPQRALAEYCRSP